MAAQLVEGADACDLAGLDEDDFVELLQVLESMRHDESRHVRPMAEDQLAGQIRFRRRIDRAQWIVQ